MKVGTIKGIKIKLHFSTLFIVGLVGFYSVILYIDLARQANHEVILLELILVFFLNGILILLSILIHELSHSLMALRYGLKVSEIELYLFGGVSKMEEEPKTPKSELLISIIGPISSFVFGASFLALFFLTPIPFPAWLLVTLFYSGITNIGLGIFNLLPAFPMDGGRVLRAFLWNRRKNLLSATKTASKVGSFFGYSLMVLGFIQMIFIGIFGGFWLILMGSFLNSAAKKSYYQTANEVALTTITVRKILGAARKFVLPYELPLIDAIRDYFMVFNQYYFPVVKEVGEIVGILHLEDIKQIPIEKRSEYTVGDVAKNLSELPTVFEEETGKDVMKKLTQMDKKPYIAVVKEREDQNIIGFVDKTEVINALKFWESYALNEI
jgi:Zn-dependent protease/CBS domain-containing protein